MVVSPVEGEPMFGRKGVNLIVGVRDYARLLLSGEPFTVDLRDERFKIPGTDEWPSFVTIGFHHDPRQLAMQLMEGSRKPPTLIDKDGTERVITDPEEIKRFHADLERRIRGGQGDPAHDGMTLKMDHTEDPGPKRQTTLGMDLTHDEDIKLGLVDDGEKKK